MNKGGEAVEGAPKVLGNGFVPDRRWGEPLDGARTYALGMGSPGSIFGSLRLLLRPREEKSGWVEKVYWFMCGHTISPPVPMGTGLK